MEYEASLDRAIDALPDLTGSQDRLQVPDATVQADGAFTRLTNLAAIADALDRDPEHLHSHVQRELGTAGQEWLADSYTDDDFGRALETQLHRAVSDGLA